MPVAGRPVRGAAGTAGTACTAVPAVPGVGRGVAASTGVGVPAGTTVTAVRGLAPAGADAAVVLCVAARGGVVALVVGVDAAASPPLASWSTSLAAMFPLSTLDSVEFRFDRFPPSFPTELVLPPEIEPDVAAPVLDEADWPPWEVP